MSAVTSTKSVSLRIILTSARAFDIGIAALGAIALALAFPKANLAWLAPLGAAALFWLWYTSSWKRAFWLGWFAGFIFFVISLSWVGHTVGSYLGALAPAVVVLPAILEGFFVGLAGIAASLAFQNASRWVAPFAAAAAFPIFEWIRSVGWIGSPFAQLGYSQADTPLALFAAYIGTYGVTFVVCIIGAYLADAVVGKTPRRFVAALGAIAFAWAICWWAWPARQTSSGTFMRVAVIQGNITQSLKWVPGSVPIAIARYVKMTQQAAAFHPELIVWPETVIPEPLNEDPHAEQRFAKLAQHVHATLIVGAQEIRDGGIYNALYIFGPNGALENIYEKRQLVPFAESLPAKRYLNWIPYISELAGTFASGTVDGVYSAGSLSFAPLICWESAFADLTHAQIRNGAQLLVISTDDAWFGETAGPPMHAQIAQLRAIENGTWVIRAAATGISGIIAPDGGYTAHSPLDKPATLYGFVSFPPGSIFANIGPTPIIISFAILYLAILMLGTRRFRRLLSVAERRTDERSHGWQE